MSEKEVTTIMVGNHKVGIIGLSQVIEAVSETFAQKDDDEVQVELLSRLSRKNYIPDSVKDGYGRAFLREFRKFLGHPYAKDNSDTLEIKVLGPGCAQCDRLEMEIREIIAEIDLAADLEHVRDIKEIGRYGVMGTPALIINGKVKAVGRVPPRGQIKNWLKGATPDGRIE